MRIPLSPCQTDPLPSPGSWVEKTKQNNLGIGPLSQNTHRCFANSVLCWSNLIARNLSVSSLVAIVWPSNHNPSFPIGYPCPTRTLFLTIKLRRKLWSQQHVTKIFSQLQISQYKSPLFRIFHRFFRIPKVHSTSLQTHSRFEKKYPSRVVHLLPSYGGPMQISTVAN